MGIQGMGVEMHGNLGENARNAGNRVGRRIILVGMYGVRVGLQGIGVEMQGIKVGIRGIGVGMWRI